MSTWNGLRTSPQATGGQGFAVESAVFTAAHASRVNRYCRNDEPP